MSQPAPTSMPSSQPAPEVARLLGAVRSRLRAYVWLEGLGLLAAAAGLGFWLSLGIDWLFEPPRGVRLLLLAAALTGFAAIVYRRLVRRLWAPLDDARLALVIERHYPSLGESLITTVEWFGRGEPAGRFGALLLEETARRAARRAAEVRPAALFEPAPLWRALSLGGLAALTVAACLWAEPQAVGTWARRALLLSEELWPRRVRLYVDGFDGGRLKIARGSDLSLAVRADTRYEVPRVVELRYRTAEGESGRVNMSREGNALAGRDRFQQFAHTFPSVLAPMTLEVVGGDARIRDLVVQVVDSPTITEMMLDCIYPDYTRREPRQLSVSGTVPLPEGTRGQLRITSSKPLVGARVDRPVDGEPLASQRLELGDGSTAPRRFELSLDPLSADRWLWLTLYDIDGIHNREPVRLLLSVVPDEAPLVKVRPQGVGSSITANARIPLAGLARDDYRVTALWCEAAVAEGAVVEQPLAIGDEAEGELEVRWNFEVASLRLEPGQTFSLVVKARDNYTLGDAPHTGSSSATRFEVVTPEALRGQLENRELNLRRRFETILDELSETQTSLARLELAPGSAPVASEPAAPGAEPAPAADAEAAGPRPSAAPPADDAESLAAQRTIRIERALHNSRKNSAEVMDVSTSFQAIHDELVNNRIDTPELRSRLKEGIADPLAEIVEVQFGQLEQHLRRLRETAAEPAASGQARQLALVQLQDILQRLAAVRDRMLELENFHEVVALLRTIVEAQEGLNAETQQRRRRQARELVE